MAVDIKTYFEPAKKIGSVGDLVNVLLPNALMIAGIVAFIGVVVTGFKIISHSGEGDAKGIEQDKGAFTAALGGLILIFGAYAIVEILGYITGVKIK